MDILEDEQYPDNDEYVPYVTGSNLQTFTGKVTLWGKVTKPANEGFYVKTVDDREILIKLANPIKGPLQGWYEIYGVPQAQGGTILCEDYVAFKGDSTKKIDIEGHKALAKLLFAMDDPWKIIPDPAN